jgi:hypothetical protein
LVGENPGGSASNAITDRHAIFAASAQPTGPRVRGIEGGGGREEAPEAQEEANLILRLLRMVAANPP